MHRTPGNLPSTPSRRDVLQRNRHNLLSLHNWHNQMELFLPVHHTANHICRRQLKCDGTRWRTGGRSEGGICRMKWVASTLHTTSEHGVSSITTADGAHLGCQQSTELTPRRPGRFKWTGPFIISKEVDSSWNVMARGDAREGEVKGKLANAVGNQYPSHYLGTRCIQHYYRWWRTPRLPAVDWTDAPPTGPN